MNSGLIAAALLFVLGTIFLIYYAWARAGRTPRARRWMGEGLGERIRDENFAVIVSPTGWLGCWATAVVVLPASGGVARVAAIGLLAVLFIPLLAGGLFLPMPNFLYPRWARERRRERTRKKRAMRQGLDGTR